MRLKFEAKLNEMHGKCRDLTTVLLRTEIDLRMKEKVAKDMTTDYKIKSQENIELNQNIIGLNTVISSLKEQKNSLNREILIKTNQITEFDSRLMKSQDELDLI